MVWYNHVTLKHMVWAELVQCSEARVQASLSAGSHEHVELSAAFPKSCAPSCCPPAWGMAPEAPCSQRPVQLRPALQSRFRTGLQLLTWSRASHQWSGSSFRASSESAGTGNSSRSKAAAYLKLSQDPQVIVESITRLVEEDFTGHRAGPGASAASTGMRAWLEHRSHIPALASDQASVDSGSWLLASEYLLEPAAPLQSFAKHRPPDISEAQHTRILDPRWILVAVSRVKERESFIEVRKKLGNSRPCGAAEEPSKGKDKGNGKGPNAKGARGSGDSDQQK